MAIQYPSSVRQLFMQRGITQNLLGSNTNSAVNRGITVYSGAQPGADTIVSSWASYNTSYLIHWQNIPLVNWNAEMAFPVLTNSTLPAAVTAINTGTAAWAIVWAANPAAGTAAGQISNATIPTTSFIIVPVSDIFGNGVIKMTTTSIVSGSSYMFLDFTLRAGGL